MRRVAALLLALPVLAHGDVWAPGVWATGVWAPGVWAESAPLVAVPNVVGEANAAAADAILEGDGLDAGSVTERCSDAADDEVIGQTPESGAMVALGSLVDLRVSNGVVCLPKRGRRIGIGLGL